MIPYRYANGFGILYGLLTIHIRGSEQSATPMPGIGWESKSLLKALIQVKSSAGPSKDKGKGKAVKVMDEGKSERGRSVSLTVSEFKGVFHGGSGCFIYDWINDEHGDSSLEGLKEMEWLTDQSYQDASKEPIEWLSLYK
jgi:hypothetical protein